MSDADLRARPDGSFSLKLTQDDAVEIIERLRETHAGSMGRAFMLRLGALTERLGAKWEAKRDLVFDHLKTSFERKFPEPNWCIKIGDDAFLAVIITLGEHKGALSAAELWYSTGHFFVGDVSAVAVPLFEVLARDVDEMTLRPIDLGKYFDRAQARPFQTAATPLPPAPALEPPHTSEAVGTMTAMSRQSAGTSLLNLSGRNIRVACGLESVFEMKKMVVIGYRFEAMAIETAGNFILDARALTAMTWADREQVDQATIAQGIKLLAMKPPDQRKLLMIVPAAFSSFASARSRQRILGEIGNAARSMGLKVLFEIRDLNGVPPHRVLEVLALIKPFCMTVMGNVGPEPRAIAGLKGCGLSGACVDYDGTPRNDEALTQYLTALSAAARAATGACMVRGFDSLHQVAVARLAGITHASAKAVSMNAPRNPS